MVSVPHRLHLLGKRFEPLLVYETDDLLDVLTVTERMLSSGSSLNP
jgi:hypothetical protein